MLCLKEWRRRERSGLVQMESPSQMQAELNFSSGLGCLVSAASVAMLLEGLIPNWQIFLWPLKADRL